LGRHGRHEALPRTFFRGLTFGWQLAFVALGLLGFVWVVFWALFFDLTPVRIG
jgi:hypothetical protein